jgi:hypothetical protein
VLEAGDTKRLDPVDPPGFQVYEVAPDPVRVTELPIHTDGEAGEITTVGTGLTVSATVLVVVHPNALFPITE